jgi:hypothetical protein
MKTMFVVMWLLGAQGVNLLFAGACFAVALGVWPRGVMVATGCLYLWLVFV